MIVAVLFIIKKQVIAATCAFECLSSQSLNIEISTHAPPVAFFLALLMPAKRRRSSEDTHVKVATCDAPPASKAGTTTVKCSLAGLRCSSDLRYEIEEAVRKVHSIAVKGSLVATQVVLSALERGHPVPNVGDQTWWYRCFSCCGVLEGRKPGNIKIPRKRQPCIDADIESAAQSLFAGKLEWTSMDYLWSFIAELSRDALTACQNMVASIFHIQLEKAFRREIIIWEVVNGREIPKKSKWRIATHYIRLTTDHALTMMLTPDDIPVDLGVQLERLVKSWKLKYAEVLPCPHSSFIYGDSRHLKTSALVQWLYDLQLHRAACLQYLNEILPPSQDASQILGKWAKAVGLLPVFSFHPKQIAISPTGLESLLKSGGIKELQNNFFDCFPGIAKHHNGLRRQFSDYIRTDGMSCSLTFSNMKLPEPNAKKRKLSTENEGKSPILPEPNQRIVAIDPGRRDMIAAVVPGDVSFKESLKSYKYGAKTTKTANYTLGLLERAKCPDGISLRSKLESLPSRRDISEWHLYTEAVVPLLAVILETYCALGLRRWKFRAYIFRDKTLDKICHKITSSPANLPTLVAFGAANSCSTGFGYAPAPQARLRRRLEKIHGAYVCLIDEFNTSQKCCSCHQQLKPGVASGLDRHGEYHHRKELHGVRCCENCHNAKGSKQFWHRDYNAAMNILACYMAVASGQKRPDAFDRSFN